MLPDSFLKMLKIVKTCENPYVEGFVGPWGFFFFLNVKKLWELVRIFILKDSLGLENPYFFFLLMNYDTQTPKRKIKDKKLKIKKIKNEPTTYMGLATSRQRFWDIKGIGQEKD